MPLSYIGTSVGFSSQTYDETDPSKYAKQFLDVDVQDLILRDLNEFHNPTTRPVDRLLDFVIYRTRKKFLIDEFSVKMLHLNDVFKRESDIWTESPGLPWTTYGVKTKGEIRDDPENIRAVRKFWHLFKIGDDIDFPDCCAFAGSHVCDADKHKVRTIWDYPATLNFGEAVFAWPLIEAYQRLLPENTPIAYGLETATGGAKKIRERFARSDKYYYSLGFSNFDKTVPAWLIEIAFDIVKYNIDYAHYQEYGVAHAQRMVKMFDRIRDYFIHTTVRMSNGKRYKKDCGIPSGSYFTQLVGSIVNCIVITYAILTTTRRKFNDAVFLGDKSFFSCDMKVDIAQIASVAERLGMKINVEQSQVSRSIDEMKFLGYYINHGLSKKTEGDLLPSTVENIKLKK